MNVTVRLLIILLMGVSCSVVRGSSRDTRSDSIDIINIDLSLDVSDFSSRVLHGRAGISFFSRVDVNSIRLDLLRLIVDSVKEGNVLLHFGYNDSVITVSLATSVSAYEQQTISIFYHGTPIQMPGDFGGFYWDNLYAFNIGVSFLAEPHNYGKVWFPCFDNFVERSTFHFAVTTDLSRRAMCNGHLDSAVIHPNHTRTWYWTMGDRIPSYLASMTVSDYALLRDTFASMRGIVPILLAARIPDTANLKRSFIHLKNALSIFENRFGPYEFNRVGYCMVPFSAGAMEHATNISYMEALVNGNTAYENVMAHELSHHWFGDLVTCDDERDMWLNEGWARYCEEVFFEGLYGPEHYKIDMRDNHEDVIRMAHIIDSAYWPVSGIPPGLTYSNYSVYEQGADRVHTLRGYMGDSLFFACLRGYLQRYKFSAVNSYTLRDYLVASSGLKNINDFFNDWIFGCGFPDFSIEHTRVNSTSSGYEVGISIRQRQDHTSHYFTNVPLEVAYFDSLGNKTVRKSSVSGSCTQFFTILPFDPAYIALDFDEKLSDAVTDQWFMMSGTNQRIDFEVAKMTVNLKQSTDSSLVRIEHHFVAPDASMNPIRGLHLSDYRYWDVGGLWSADFQASAIVAYNGSKNAQGYLDNTLITNSEDSLVLMYRADAESMWQIDSGAVRNTQGSMTDKIGTFAISNLQKGQYALAIYQADKVDSPQTIAGCAAPLMADDAAEGFKAYPNAAHAEELNIEIEGKDVYKRCIMINMIGDMVMDRTLKEGQNKFTVYMNGLPRGTYMISLIDKDNKRISKKIQKQS